MFNGARALAAPRRRFGLQVSLVLGGLCDERALREQRCGARQERLWAMLACRWAFLEQRVCFAVERPGKIKN